MPTVGLASPTKMATEKIIVSVLLVPCLYQPCADEVSINNNDDADNEISITSVAAFYITQLDKQRNVDL